MLGIVTVIAVGLLVGVELAVAGFTKPVFDQLPHAAALAARARAAALLGRVMPWFYITSVLLAVAWTVLAWGGAQAWWSALAALLLLASVVLSVLLLVPINTRVAQWSHEQAPPGWRSEVHRWDLIHYVRVGVILIAFVLLTITLAR